MMTVEQVCQLLVRKLMSDLHENLVMREADGSAGWATEVDVEAPDGTKMSALIFVSVERK